MGDSVRGDGRAVSLAASRARIHPLSARMPRTMSANRLLVIGRRFCGPPGSGNGGYTCGMLAAAAAEPVEVRLMRPPPLEKALAIRDEPAGSGFLLMDGEEMVASATP